MLIPREQAASRSVRAFRAFEDRASSEPWRGPRAGEIPTQLAPVETEVASLAERVRDLEEALIRERSEREKACEDSFAAGRDKGRGEAESDSAERLRILREAVREAVAELHQALDQRGDMAVAIARAALAKMFGQQASYGSMVEATIRHQLAQIAEGSVIGIRVSAQDFEDDGGSPLFAAEGVRISREASLPAGSCLFDLTLGTLDASIPRQAGALDAVLGSVAASRGDEA
jgi:flagellar biosynthesis/type III secretory pathway protein FliH